jgi:hypothetical protein
MNLSGLFSAVRDLRGLFFFCFNFGNCIFVINFSSFDI